MNKSFGIIYKATNLINGKCYIGQTTKTLNDRIKGHLNASKSKSKRNVNNYFYRAIRKYGYENFKWEILCECENKELLDIRETMKIIVEHSYKTENGYNLTWGGDGKFGCSHTKKTIDKIKSHWTKEKRNDKYIEQKTIWKSEELRKNVSNKIKNLWAIPENHKRFCDCMKGKKVRQFTNEHKENISISKMGAKNPNFNKQMKKSSLEKRSKNTYLIKHPDGHIENTKVLSCWCRENNLNYGSLLSYIKKGVPYKGFIINKIF